jgi:hypothetical protein
MLQISQERPKGDGHDTKAMYYSHQLPFAVDVIHHNVPHFTLSAALPIMIQFRDQVRRSILND